MTSELDLEQLEKVARAATGAAEPSDWQADVYPVVKRLAAFEGQTTGSVDRLIECDGVYGTMDGRVATHIATFDPPTVLALIARLREAEAKVERVREVHADLEGGALELADNGRKAEASIFTVHARKLRDALM